MRVDLTKAEDKRLFDRAVRERWDGLAAKRPFMVQCLEHGLKRAIQSDDLSALSQLISTGVRMEAQHQADDHHQDKMIAAARNGEDGATQYVKTVSEVVWDQV